MTTRQISRFRTILKAMRDQLARQLHDGSRLLVIENHGDPLDRILARYECDAELRSLDLRIAMLRKVDGALREIDEGTFGRCVSCDCEIPMKRLEAVPWSPYCVSCQQRIEHDHSQVPEAPGGPYALAS